MFALRTIERTIERSALTSARCALNRTQPCLRGVSNGSTAALPAAFLPRLPQTPPVAGILGQQSWQLASNTADAGETSAEHTSQLLDVLGKAYPVFVLTKMDDISSMRVKNLLRGLGVPFRDVQLDGLSREEVGAIEAQAGSVPSVYVGGRCMGDFQQVQQQFWSGELSRELMSVDVPCSGSYLTASNPSAFASAS